jgi:hypothetical protein
MIRFFRRIRKGLFSQNRFSKYLLYAVGEILLVVIGILIALQVNNWNESRKKEQLMERYLVRLINDISKDTININKVIRTVNRSQVTIQKIIQTLNTDLDFVQFETVAADFFEMGWVIYDFVPTTNTYRDLSQTGNMNIINNSNLSESLNMYYGLIEELKGYNEVNKNWITPLDQELGKLTAAFEIDPGTSHLFPKETKLRALKDLLTNKDLLQRTAAGHYWINQSLIGNLNVLKKESKKLIEIINQYNHK